MLKKLKWTLFSLLTAVTLCACGGETNNNDPADPEPEPVVEEITATKEGIIEYINKYFSDVDNMTSFGVDARYETNIYTDNTWTELQSSTDSLVGSKFYGTNDFVWSMVQSGTSQTHAIYTPDEDDYYCTNYITLDTSTEDPTIDSSSHSCGVESYNGGYPARSTSKLHEISNTHFRSFSMYMFSDGETATYSLSQYDWEETDEENTWVINYEYELFYAIFYKSRIDFSGTWDYWVNISINDDGNLEIAAHLGGSTVEEVFTLELTEVGTISKTYEELEEFIDTYGTTTSVLYANRHSLGTGVMKEVYLRDTEDDEWVLSTLSTNNDYASFTLNVGVQVGLKFTKSGSTMLDIYYNNYDYDFLTLDEEYDLYYYTVPVHVQYIYIVWTE